MKAVVINSQNEIIAEVELSENAREVEVAGTVTIEGAPVNRRTYTVSRSKANLARAARMDLDTLTKRTYKGSDFYI
ncbi:hypothetical protein V8U11_09245 [Pseudomonas chlororaphis]|uniref:hypothetical protein n=1 Tax=Pseudomonas chlororaphis TaxID=587753 RepID=UPI0030D081F2